MTDKPNSLKDIDAFWDLESLLPQKKTAPSSRRVLNTDTVEITVGKETASPSLNAAIPPREKVSNREEARRLNEISLRSRAAQNEPKPEEPYLVYEPSGSAIRRVSVSAWQTRYRFYEKFASDARRFWDRTAPPCEPVPFFSYIPQYNQLKYAQLKWYLYWRSLARTGEYLPTDYSYLLLYLYEILNCPDLIAPKDGLDAMVSLWLACRNRYPRLDQTLAEWVCDYCLIHRLACPAEKLEPIFKAVVSAASLKEFYMDMSKYTEGAAGVLAFSSNYDWRSSRYVTKENIKLFSHHIRAAFLEAYREILEKQDDGVTVKETEVVRDAYAGALCVWDQKRCLKVEYLSYTRSPKFRFLVTDIIKYSENRIRMALGIKARLKVENLTEPIIACLDRYFDENLPAKVTSKRKKEEAEAEAARAYDALYEPIDSHFSLENALSIEKKSWETTEVLTNAFTEETEEPPKPASFSPVSPIPQNPAPMPADPCENPFSGFVSGLTAAEREVLLSLADENGTALAELATKCGMLPDALADKLNETAFDLIGDAIIEPSDGGYRLIPDYQEDLLSCLK